MATSSIFYCNNLTTGRRSVGRIADPVLVDGAVLNPNPSTGLYTFSSILGTAHAGSALGTQGDADSRMAGGYFDLLLFRSTTPQAVWDPATVYDYSKFGSYKVYRRSGVAVGWSGHTWNDPSTKLRPKDDGAPGNLVDTPFTLPWGLYFAILTTKIAGGATYEYGNNGLWYFITPSPGIPEATLHNFLYATLGDGQDRDVLLAATTNGDLSLVPLNEGSASGYGGYAHTWGLDSSPVPLMYACVLAAQVVRFRVNRLEWSN